KDLQGHQLDSKRLAARADWQVAARTVAGHAPGEIAMGIRAAATACVFLTCANPAQATPDLRLGRTAGPLTVYPDDTVRTLFYYPPGDLAIATRDDGSPDLHLLHARYTGSVVTGDQGTAAIRSIFTVRLVMSGPLPLQLAAARQALAAAAGGVVELRP